MEKIRTSRFDIRVFLTSRPELPIRLGFSEISMVTSRHEQIILQEISRSIIEHDISVFLRTEFSNIRLKNQVELQFSPDWPGDEAVQKLTMLAAPLFIFAATVCRFVGGASTSSPMKLLDTVSTLGTAEAGLISQLSQTYLPVLNHLKSICAPVKFEQFRAEFKKLLGIDENDVYIVLRHLHSVLDVPSEPNLPIRLLHLSFKEFLVDPEKKSKIATEKDKANGNWGSNKANNDFWFWIDERKIHRMLAYRSLDVLSAYLKENICSLDYPGMFREEVEVSRIDTNIPGCLRYACSYWIHHLKCGFEDLGLRNEDADRIYAFLCKHFLHWLEALSLVGRMTESVLLIETLSQLAKESESIELSSFLYDANTFLLQSWKSIDKAPLQIYSSAQIFSPEASVIRKIFQNCVPKWISRWPEPPEPWKAALKLELNTLNPSTLAFSPDGRFLASTGQSAWSISVWNTRTGEHVGYLRDHDYDSNKPIISFSPNDRYLGSLSRSLIIWDAVLRQQFKWLIVALSENTIIELWDVDMVIQGRVTPGTDQAIRVFRGHSGVVTAVVYSPDGKLLASASIDKTVRIWDPATGQQLLQTSVATFSFWSHFRTMSVTTGEQVQTSPKKSRGCVSMALSPSGTELALGTADGRTEIWDTTTRQMIKVLCDCGTGSEISAVAYSPDGKVLASASPFDSTIRLWDTVIEQRVSSNASPLRNWEMQLRLREKTAKLRRVIARRKNPVKRVKEEYLSGLGVVFSPNGEQVAVREYSSKEVKVLGVNSNSGELGCSIRGLAFSFDCKQLASAIGTLRGGSTQIELWDIKTGQKIKYVCDSRLDATVMTFSPNGERLALATQSRNVDIQVLDVATDEELRSWDKRHAVTKLCFSSDGEHLETGSEILSLAPNLSSSRSVQKSPRAQLCFEVRRSWIYANDVRLLWLPVSYTCDSSAQHGNLFVVSRPHPVEGVSIFEFTGVLDKLILSKTA
ncbi:hypothetical protein TWF569_006261 [Orbilia oligospora]|nr:hypothetical protein TWF569_006261 [Orbilia oligospora]